MTPRYASHASLLIESEQANVLSIEEVYGLDSSRKEYFQTQYEILRSRKVAQRVVDKLNLIDINSFNLDVHEAQKNALQVFVDDTKLFVKSLLPFLPQALNDEKTEEELAIARRRFATDVLMENLKISPLVNTQVVQIRYINEDPQLAALIANTVADMYIESYLQSKLEMTAKATAWLNESLQGLRTKLDEAERVLAEFDEKEQLVNVGGVSSLATDELQKLNNQLIEAQVVLQRNEAIYQQVNRQSVSLAELATVPDVLNHPSIQSVKREEVVAQSKVSELKEVYGPKHPVMIAANAELNSIKSSLRNQISILISGITNEYRATQLKVSALIEDIELAKVEFRQLTNLVNQRRALQRDVDINQQLYDSFFTRLKETDQLGGFESANARILDLAEPSIIPSEPRVGVIVIAVFLTSIAFGCFLALSIEALNSGVRSVEDIERKLGQRLLGIIPRAPQKNKQDLPLRYFFGVNNHLFSEAVRTIRTSLQLLNIDKSAQTILVTSSVPKEGKSTVSINLAFAMGQLNKVLLIDADLRKPTIGKRFDLPGFQPGLANVVSGTHTLQESIVHDEHSNVDVLCAGSLPPNPQEILASESLIKLMSVARDAYDYIIIDSAPIQAVSDAVVLSKVSDSLVYVVKSDSTHAKVIETGLGRFVQIGHRIDGIVLNQVDINKAKRSGEYSGFYDQYGYSNYTALDSKAT